MSARPETVARLYDLMPRVYRTRDAGQLAQLIEVIAGQIDVLEESLDQFHDDQFVETAAAWAVPYLGDLIGYRPLAGPFGSPRAEVANTIAYRRRKGTAAMLEQLAFDVTGWKARAVEFFERLTVTQYMNHVRPGKGGTPDLRHPALLEWIGTPFDDHAHTAEVRRITTRAGRYNIHNVGIFLWRVEAVELTRSPLVPDTGSQRRFRFHPLGIDSQLYGAPRTEDEITHLATQLDVPLPLTRRWLKAHADTYYGKDRSLLVGLLGAATPGKVRFCDLSDVPGDWAHAPAPGSGEIAIDPVLGRVYFPEPVTGLVRAVATYHYGTAMRIGGGYARSPYATDGPVVADPDLQTALDQVTSGGTVEIEDNGRYAQTPVLRTDDAKTVVLRAADRHRPLLAAAGPIELKPGRDGTVVLDGLMISGGPLVLKDAGDIAVRKVILKHCTLVPGLTRTPDNGPGSPTAASLIIEHPFAAVEIERCVTGPITAVEGATVAVRDSVVEAPAGTALAVGTLKLDESTVIGTVDAVRVDISNSIVLGTVSAQRRQEGCVRFSYLTEDSLTPQKYRCVSQPSPDFTSLRFADPGYCQLRVTTADEIRRGADNGSEMGVGNHLFAPQREANLLARLDEYLRFGLEAGIFYAS
ncbi:hypothetical protein AB0M35_20270 [Micromonospora sp. NPDC051196]|uniref:hypothetical protein n=1 Tax=Micromonospora sp. NPDC051196 TaxID=3155281 RepID=UPI0034281A8B